MSFTVQADQGTIPPFDGAPIKAALFLRNIEEFAARNGWLTLLLKGYIITRGMITCASADALLNIKNHHLDPVEHPLPESLQDPPDPPIAATRNSEYTPTAEDRRLYQSSPEIFLHSSSIVLEHILKAVSNPDVARRIRTPVAPCDPPAASSAFSCAISADLGVSVADAGVAAGGAVPGQPPLHRPLANPTP